MEMLAVSENRSISTGTVLSRIDDAARDYISNSKARSTVRSYQADWAHFDAWCNSVGLKALPATNETVARYLTCFAKVYKVSTLQRRISAINQAHRMAKFRPISLRDEPLHSIWSGIKKVEGTAQEGKKPVRFSDIVQAVQLLPKTMTGVRDRALLLVGFAGAFRRSELVALNHEDLEFTHDGLIIHIRRSKTDQEGHGEKIALTYLPNPDVCPIRALLAWLQAASITSGAVFRGVDKVGRVLETRKDKTGRVYSARLCDKVVALRIKIAMASIGKDASDFSGHSLRAGFATSAAENGIPERIIMKQTRHKSLQTVRKYIRDGDLFRENATSFMAQM